MAHAVWKGHIAFGMVSFPYADSADSLLNNGAAGSMAPEGRDVGAHLEHLEDIWRRQSVMKTMGLIPDVLTSGEKFDIGLGSLDRPIFPHFGGK